MFQPLRDSCLRQVKKLVLTLSQLLISSAGDGDKADNESFKGFINTKVDTMTKILEVFKMDLDAEGVARYKLGQDLERAKHDATKTKGRMGVMETKMKELRSDFDELEVPTAEEQHCADRPSRRGQHEEVRLEQMQAQLTRALEQIKVFGEKLEAQSDDIFDLQGQLEGGPSNAAHKTRGLSAQGYAGELAKMNKAQSWESDLVGFQSSAHCSSSHIEPLTVRVQAFIKKTLQTMSRKAEMQQLVDDMYSKDQLYIAFKQLTTGTFHLDIQHFRA